MPGRLKQVPQDSMDFDSTGDHRREFFFTGGF